MTGEIALPSQVHPNVTGGIGRRIQSTALIELNKSIFDRMLEVKPVSVRAITGEVLSVSEGATAYHKYVLYIKKKNTWGYLQLDTCHRFCIRRMCSRKKNIDTILGKTFNDNIDIL